MAQVINTNIASLTAQRNLNSSQSQLQTSLERLSSGLRINSAKDDAAGLAISERFTAQINGQNQAVRNANDGISFAQTAEGALSEIGNIAQRIRELAVQSANATNSASDREALNNEVKQSISEINRIASSTQFNSSNVLDGSLEDLIFQVGANAGQTIKVDGMDSRGSELGALLNSTTDLADVDAGASVAGVTGLSVNEAFAEGTTGTFTVTINGAAGTTTITGTASSMDDIVSAINAETGDTGIKANLTADGGDLVFSSALDNDGEGFDVGVTMSIGGTSVDSGTIALDSNSITLNDVSVETVDNANKAVVTVDYVLDQVNSMRADLGAVQNRFESTVNNLQVSSENLSASRSRIQDADFAAETAALTRSQILQQAGTSVLAQANQTPNNVLALLQ
ncbi:flagellin [Ectothiorhodospira mobilis]|uniref:flagellin n=1 Tax=Ectothiorhodospira mobilis TaxID=195064 RepID=UPI001EE90A76|nr:flagellin [Ectothiorhodospira mobilis]MCG5536378.1 flagellin [Ectothiorhodospira mobilis]